MYKTKFTNAKLFARKRSIWATDEQLAPATEPATRYRYIPVSSGSDTWRHKEVSYTALSSSGYHQHERRIHIVWLNVSIATSRLHTAHVPGNSCSCEEYRSIRRFRCSTHRIVNHQLIVLHTAMFLKVTWKV